jgi:IMP dehydrogenase/GMP reductase
MDTITGVKFAKAAMDNGITPVLHKYVPYEEIKELHETPSYRDRFFITIGPKAIETEEGIEKLIELNPLGICIDCAHADSVYMLESVRFVREMLYNNQLHSLLMAGNVSTPTGVQRLCDAGADIIKIGVGPGSVCTTRIKTGVGVPQLSAIETCSNLKTGHSHIIVADGGMKTPGDMAKALAAGAKLVMTGSMFAGCLETEDPNKYRGMASVECMDPNDRYKTPEGEVKIIHKHRSVKEAAQDILGGLRSAFSYCGAYSLDMFQNNAELIEVTRSTAVENTAHFEL